MSRLDLTRVTDVRHRASREVDAGVLPSCQFAVGYEGEVIASETLGDASGTDRYCIFSASKPITTSALWASFASGDIDISAPVTDYLPGFAGRSKGDITVENILTHTAGLPNAKLTPAAWTSHDLRIAEMANWVPATPAGSAFAYHPTSAHWVAATILEEVTGTDFRDVIHARVSEPIGIPRIFGDPSPYAARPAKLVGTPTPPAEIAAFVGVDPDELGALNDPDIETTPEFLIALTEDVNRRAGTPGAGGFMTATDLALVYQHFLHDPGGIFDPHWRHDALNVIRNDIADIFGTTASRTTSFVISGEEPNRLMRGLGETVSTAAFGHGGAAGQIAWADPETGVSFAFVTDGFDVDFFREAARTYELNMFAGQIGKADA